MKKALLVGLALLVPLLSGCQSAQMDRKALCLMMAIDYQGDEITLTAIFPKLTGGQGEESEYTTLAVKDDKLAGAIEKLDAGTHYHICYEQLRLLALGEETGKRGIGDVVERLSAIPRMRMNAQVLLVDGDAGEFVAAIKPDFGNRVSKFLTFKLDKLSQQQLVPNATLGQVRRDLLSDRRDAMLVLGSVNQKVDKEQKKEQPSQGGDQPAFAQAGELLEKSDDPAEILGAAALREGKLVKKLNAEETKCVLMLMGKAELRADEVILSPTFGEEAKAVLQELCQLGSDVLGLAHQEAMRTGNEPQGFRERLMGMKVVLGEGES